MDVPEVPLAAVEAVVGCIERVLAHLAAEPYVAWWRRARLALLRGDEAEVAAWIERLLPTLNRSSGVHQHTGCASCRVLDVAGSLPRSATPEALGAVLDPLLKNEPRWSDPPDEVEWLDETVGSGICKPSRAHAHRLLARRLADAGRAREAATHADEALALSDDDSADERARLLTMQLDVARAQKDGATVARHLDALVPLLDRLQDAYEVHDALVASCLALAATPAAARAVTRGRKPAPDPGAPARAAVGRELRARALEVARRLDARLERPRHVRDTEARLPR